IQPSLLRLDGSDGARDGLVVSDIELHRARTDSGRRLLSPSGVARAEIHGVSGGDELPGGLESDAPGGAGDERYGHDCPSERVCDSTQSRTVGTAASASQGPAGPPVGPTARIALPHETAAAARILTRERNSRAPLPARRR